MQDNKIPKHQIASELKKIGVGTLEELYQARGWSNLEEFMEQDLNQIIDHTLLKPEANQQAHEEFLATAIKSKVYSVCVAPYWVGLAAKVLRNQPIQVCSVVGFPLGHHHPQQKCREAEQALSDGAKEIDMVLNLGAFKSLDYNTVERDIAQIAKLCSSQGILKVILETCLLETEEIILACKIASQAGAHFVKTSTGFNKAGASVEAIRLMRDTVGNQLGVKASGGVSDRASALAMLKAGATRIGSSKSNIILEK